MCQALQTPAPSPFFNVTGCGRRSTPIARSQAWAGGLAGPALDSETRRAAGLLGDGAQALNLDVSRWAIVYVHSPRRRRAV